MKTMVLKVYFNFISWRSDWDYCVISHINFI